MQSRLRKAALSIPITEVNGGSYINHASYMKAVNSYLIVNDFKKISRALTKDLKNTHKEQNIEFRFKFAHSLECRLRSIVKSSSTAPSLNNQHDFFLSLDNHVQEQDLSKPTPPNCYYTDTFDIKNERHSLWNAVNIFVNLKYLPPKLIHSQPKFCKKCFRIAGVKEVCYEHDYRRKDAFNIHKHECLPLNLDITDTWSKFEPLFHEEIQLLQNPLSFKGAARSYKNVCAWLLKERKNAYQFLLSENRIYTDIADDHLGRATSILREKIDEIPYRHNNSDYKDDPNYIPPGSMTLYKNYISKIDKCQFSFWNNNSKSPIPHITHRIDRIEAWFRAYHKYNIKFKGHSPDK